MYMGILKWVKHRTILTVGFAHEPWPLCFENYCLNYLVSYTSSFLAGKWELGWILCDIWISLDILLCTASILSLCAISVDRYLAVTRPLTYSRRRRSKKLALTMILFVWIAASAITCPPMLGWWDFNLWL